MWGSKEQELYEQACADPELFFESPERLLHDPTLTNTHKIDLLRRWARETLDIAVADEENMVGADNPSNLFDRIMDALHHLGADLEE